jgi:phosphoserine phosphatase
MQRVRLVAFDLDGTLARGDTVCEVLARKLGHVARMRELEAMAARRRDRESIRLLRDETAKYYRDVTLTELRAHLGSLTLAPGAREAFALLRRFRVATAIVTITWAFAAEWMAEELGADYHVGTRLLDDGSVDHFWPEDKAIWLEALMGRMGIRREEAVAIGDSWLDVPMLVAVGRAIYVGPTAPPGVCVAHVPGGDLYQIAREIIGGPHA